MDEFLRVFNAVQSGDIDGVTCRVMTEWDATSSGLQHLSAGTRCSELAPLVNICHNTDPGDIYSVVSTRAAEIVEEKLATEESYIDPRLATSRLPYEWKFDRTAAKRGGAMTIPLALNFLLHGTSVRDVERKEDTLDQALSPCRCGWKTDDG